jgi:predicted membrane protein
MGPEGFIYPNEHELAWSVLIAVYPFLTGLVAGAFILASLEKVFDVKALRPTYRMSLLAALAFLLAAPLPLLAHLHQPIRGYEIMATPNPTSAMAVFGFVYLWYLTAILLVEIWLEFRVDIVRRAESTRGLVRGFYYMLSLGVTDTSERARESDHRIATVVTILGIPSAILLHGYVGFIFGSIKANPWWSSVLMPVVFVFSAIVSGIALMLLLYMATTVIRRRPIDTACVSSMSSYLFYGLLVAFTLELLDTIHRTYEAEESIDIIQALMHGRMFTSVVVIQAIVGSLVPLMVLGALQVVRLPDRWRNLLSAEMALLVLIGVFTMRWNVVIGGQLFSKSLRGFTIYKLDFMGREGLATTIAICVLPLLIFAALAWILPPWQDRDREQIREESARSARPTRPRAVLASVLALLPLLGPIVLVIERAGEKARPHVAELSHLPDEGPGMWRPAGEGEAATDEQAIVPEQAEEPAEAEMEGEEQPAEPGHGEP